MSLEILCTLGPASMDERVIRRLAQSGATLFRINLSHTDLAAVAPTIKKIQQATNVPICLDTEGAQIRTGRFVDGRITFRDNTIIRAHSRRVPADDRNFSFYPAEIITQLQLNDFISIDFNSVLVQVVDFEEEAVVLRVLSGGKVGQNKAVTVERDIRLPPLTEKDRAALNIGRDLGLNHIALSFVNLGSDVEEIRSIFGRESFLISKIESLRGIDNLEEIAAHSDALLIDRGDLSRQVPIEFLPQIQKSILRRAKGVGCKVYVTANLLESMVSTPAPTPAEVNDIHNTLIDGADGLVLAAESAIGKFPIRCVTMIGRLAQSIERCYGSDRWYYPDEAVSSLVEPHGGRLVHREAIPAEVNDLDRLPSLTAQDTVLLDCEQIARGTYSPLTGFMDRETLETVLDSHRLPSGEIWPLPIVLQIPGGDAASFGPGERIAIKSNAGDICALLDVSEIFSLDLDKFAKRYYGTTSRNHPGVAAMVRFGNTFAAGDVTLVKPFSSHYRLYQLSPAQTRFIFSRLGWSQVVGFHGRNPAHRGHEFIQLEALEQTGADGLYINPVVGPKKKGDFLPRPIILSYQTMLEFGCYPKGKVVLGSFATYSRYAGPREAVFTALCRKNMGCSHFIVGRDHAGVGNFYDPGANRRMFDRLGDLDVEPVFFGNVGYNSQTGRYEVANGQPLRNLTGTEVREALRTGKHVPEWFMRDIVSEFLQNEIARGHDVFYD